MSAVALYTLLGISVLSIAAESLADSSSHGEALLHQYCIIGGGPAGLQVGHFLKHASREYVIYERNEHAGSFFAKYPRHRMLISLNKRMVREGRTPDFAFRHDWNSLIDVRPEGERTAPVTHRSELLFPHADTLTEYLKDFAEEQHERIRYGVQVTKVRRQGGGGNSGSSNVSGFVVSLARTADGAAKAWEERCQEVIVATGLWRPRGVKTRVDGAKHVEGYEEVPSSGKAFTGKSVVILGMGNAAMETAQELQKYTSEIHLYARQRPLPEGGTGVRFAYQTHYVGDIRAGRVTLLDTYLLKSLDTFDFDALDGKQRLVLLPCAGRLCLWSVDKSDCLDRRCKAEFDRGGQDLDYRLPIGSWVKGSKAGKWALRLMKKYPKRKAELDRDKHTWEIDTEDRQDDSNTFKDRVEAAESASRRASLGINDTVFENRLESLVVSSKLLRENPDLMTALLPLRVRGSGDEIRYPVDHVIRCFGWAMDSSIFDPSVNLTMSHKGKYPVIEPTYEAKGAPGIHIAGTLGHSLDFRKSAGGFIHGFRYTARALFRRLEEKNHGVPWPSTLVSLQVGEDGTSPGVDQLVQLFYNRINGASGPYQMFETLGDVALFERNETTGHWQARFFEEVPLAYWDENYRHKARLAWDFRYNPDFHGPKVLSKGRVGSTSPYTAEKSTFLHPHLFYKAAGNEKPSHRHWLSEDIFTQWTNWPLFAPFAKFVAHVVANCTGDSVHEMEGAFSLDMPDSWPEELIEQKGPVQSSSCAKSRPTTLAEQ